MLRSLHISKTGMDASQFRLDVIANNLANVNTTGFKRSRGVFEDLMYQVIRQPGAKAENGGNLPVGLMVGLGSNAVATQRIHTQGGLQNTGNTLDIAIVGEGFFRLQAPAGSASPEVYTRDGSFTLEPTGGTKARIVHIASGLPLLAQGGEVIIDTATDNPITIKDDGYILTKSNPIPPGIGKLQLATFTNPAGLNSIGSNVYENTDASGEPQVEDPKTAGVGALKQGFLENSNVNITQELVDMIQAQRAFEINSRGIKTSDEMLQRLSQL